jgi:hypothetical protein
MKKLCAAASVLSFWVALQSSARQQSCIWNVDIRVQSQKVSQLQLIRCGSDLIQEPIPIHWHFKIRDAGYIRLFFLHIFVAKLRKPNDSLTYAIRQPGFILTIQEPRSEPSRPPGLFSRRIWISEYGGNQTMVMFASKKANYSVKRSRRGSAEGMVFWCRGWLVAFLVWRVGDPAFDLDGRWYAEFVQHFLIPEVRFHPASDNQLCYLREFRPNLMLHHLVQHHEQQSVTGKFSWSVASLSFTAIAS